ncbi:MAG TPA: DsbA family protein [Rhizomicrobium sp.]|jgi:protein-disulfide isomerase|nr:DsbA family protein [Rhizomicrobium sp.]
MRDLTTIIAGALGGALLAVVIIFAAAENGMLPVPAGTVSGGAIRDYLMAHPNLVGEMTDKYQAQQQADQDKAAAAAMKKLGLNAFFDPKIAFVTGPADAKKSVVEFYDYNCPYCRASLPAVEKFYQQHKDDTRFSFIEFPIKGPDSIVAAKVALAARQQPDKYLALHFALMAESQPVDAKILMADAQKVGINLTRLNADMKDPQIAAAIDASHNLAKQAGIDGTPTFIVNGVMHPGAVDEETLNDLAAKES